MPAASSLLRYAALCCLVPLTALTAWAALEAPWQTGAFPEALFVKVELLPVVFPLHMVSGGLALALGPITLLLRGSRQLHRPLGRLAAICVIVSGLTALPVALVEPVTNVSAWGFVAQGLIWMTLLCAGVHAIRKGDAARHRACMVLMLAVMSGAMVFRIALAAFAAWGDYANFNAFYAGNAWFAWALPLSLTLLWLRRRQSDSLKF